MATVQMTIADARYAAELRERLVRGGARHVRCVESPDVGQDGVIVVDASGLDCLPLPLPNPERVVLITRNDPAHLAQAWEAGIRSVVFDHDPLSTAVLAIMAAELRAAKPDEPAPAAGSPRTAAQGLGKPGGARMQPLVGQIPHARHRERRG